MFLGKEMASVGLARHGDVEPARMRNDPREGLLDY